MAALAGWPRSPCGARCRRPDAMAGIPAAHAPEAGLARNAPLATREQGGRRPGGTRSVGQPTLWIDGLIVACAARTASSATVCPQKSPHSSSARDGAPVCKPGQPALVRVGLLPEPAAAAAAAPKLRRPHPAVRARTHPPVRLRRLWSEPSFGSAFRSPRPGSSSRRELRRLLRRGSWLHWSQRAARGRQPATLSAWSTGLPARAGARAPPKRRAGDRPAGPTCHALPESNAYLRRCVRALAPDRASGSGTAARTRGCSAALPTAPPPWLPSRSRPAKMRMPAPLSTLTRSRPSWPSSPPAATSSTGSPRCHPSAGRRP